jgi:hypothetical protein
LTEVRAEGPLFTSSTDTGTAAPSQITEEGLTREEIATSFWALTDGRMPIARNTDNPEIKRFFFIAIHNKNIANYVKFSK